MQEKKREPDSGKRIEKFRQKRKKKVKELGDFEKNYTAEDLVLDLNNYFQGEVDFDFRQIRQEIKKKNKLKDLISKARQKKTHPVIELVQEIFKNL